ncbi:uncharacterized protein BDZ99DRAFT_458727 [Mytilinidion resinicola]|uniref:Uncharacterized protein n=1 Tax=Mytilinidion resinicola TaxID=574789 RepID=A0A6A6Z1Z4_9PEZI|nr:uncharacterized protein BDZ99DRAFT_458727 [Mytilinidion resinicola]KAF2814739.1 hypothetical protein BDZ99DRAFT_458727 [Mytilinidion resinicola]
MACRPTRDAERGVANGLTGDELCRAALRAPVGWNTARERDCPDCTTPMEVVEC